MTLKTLKTKRSEMLRASRTRQVDIAERSNQHLVSLPVILFGRWVLP